MDIAVVLVTFNRIDCLKKSLACYSAQELLPKSIVVLNNASTDGTKEFLDQWMEASEGFKKIVVHAEKNVGGAGGFSRGIQEAQKQASDFIFLADDDAYAEKDALKKISDYYDSLQGEQRETVAICSSVVNMGEYDVAHRCRIRKKGLEAAIIPVQSSEYEKPIFEINIFSFVGTAIRADIVCEIGLPKAEYFIHYDDTEYALRMGKKGKMVCIPGSVMHHDTIDSETITWKDYYSARNHALMLREHYGACYFYYFIALTYLKKGSLLAWALKKRTPQQRKLYKKALVDALHEKTGIDTKYYPGRRIE